MNRFKISLFGMLLALFFVACNNDQFNSIGNDTNALTKMDNSTGAKIILPQKTAKLTLNSQTVNIYVKVVDAQATPIQTGSVKIIYPSADVLAGRDIGSFTASQEPVKNGIATFLYTAPKNLNANTSSLHFKFYYDSSIETAQPYTMTIMPEQNQIILSDYILKSNFINNTKTMNLQDTTQLNLTLFAKDEKENLTRIKSDKVTSISVKLINPELADLEDSKSGLSKEKSYANQNDISLNIRTKTISGIVPIEVTTLFKGLNNEDLNITEYLNILVFSGPPTALSLSLSGTVQDKSIAKFVDTWVLTVTDKYNNRVNTRPAISMGMIAGYAKDSTTPSGNLYHDGNGTLKNDDTFSSNQAPFQKVNLGNDNLVIFGNADANTSREYYFNRYGKWEINSKTNNTLTLGDDYKGMDTNNLKYAVGRNFRNETCSGNSVVANVYAENKDYVLDIYGHKTIKVEYDYYYVGKKVVLWTNVLAQLNPSNGSQSEQLRVGLGRPVTLKGLGLTPFTPYSFTKGETKSVIFRIKINGTQEYYRNANFKYNTVITSDEQNASSLSGNTIVGRTDTNGDITSCTNQGRESVTLSVVAAPQKGTFNVVNLEIEDEF